MKNTKDFLMIYYPAILSFLSFLYSVTLCFNGYQLEGIFVGIWVPSILGFAICIRQRRNDFYKNNQNMHSVSMFIIGSIIFILYISGMIYMINYSHSSQKEDLKNDPELKN